MTPRAVRAALIVLGAASVGLWAAWLPFRLVLARPSTGQGYLHLSLLMLPTLFGAVLAGFLLGYASESARRWPSALCLSVVLLLAKYLPYVLAGHFAGFFAGSWGPVVRTFEVIATFCFVILGTWLGYRMRGHAAVT